MSRVPTTIGYLLDETGSMHSVRDNAMAALQSFIREQRDEDQNDTWILLATFNSIRFNIDVPKQPIKDDVVLEYAPTASTPLLDSIARFVKVMEDNVVNEAVLVVIHTDGLENASRWSTKKQIRDLIREKESQDWQFAFLAAGEDVFLQGEELGMGLGRGTYYTPGQETVGAAMLSEATSKYRSSGSVKTTSFFGKSSVTWDASDHPRDPKTGRFVAK